MNTETPQTDAIAQNFHVIAATEKIQVAQYVKAWQCREIEEQVNHWKRAAMEEQRRWAVTQIALRGLMEAEEATIEGFNAEEIDALESAMAEARRVLGECEAAGTADEKPDGQAENSVFSNSPATTPTDEL